MTSTLTRASKSSAKAPASTAVTAAPTLGPQVCRWMEKNLVHGPGDKYGQPFRLDHYMRKFIWRAYELTPSGSRLVTRAVLGVAKGNAKTELAAGIACAELGGPVVFDRWGTNGQPIGKRRVSPDIPVAAASFDQADLLFGCARVMIKEGKLADFFEVYDTEILVKGDGGVMYRVAAVAGTNDGKRPTFFDADELHEWTGNKERVHLVLSNGRAKRADSWELGISTAGWDTASLLGRKYQHGMRVHRNEVQDPSLLFAWYQARGRWECSECGRRVTTETRQDKPADPCTCPESTWVAWNELEDPAELRAAIREANPASFLNVEAVAARATEIPEFEFRRYHLNQWVDSLERWLPEEAWNGCASPATALPPDGADIVLAVDGMYNGESTAIVGSTVGEQPHLFVLNAWEKGEEEGEAWKVEIEEVEHLVRSYCGRWSVRSVGMNPNRWRRSIEVLEKEGLPVVAWESHLASRMVPACAQFYDSVIGKKGKTLSHDGDDRLARHISHAVVKVDARGPRIAKDHRDTDRHIDLAVAAVVAYDLAVRAPASNDDWKPI